MSLPRPLAAAIALIEAEEGCHLHAYPDPLSPLGRLLGHSGIVRMGSGQPRPATVTRHGVTKSTSGLSGSPWTIGFGATGKGISEGSVWTMQQCRDALIDRAQNALNIAWRIYPGLNELDPLAQGVIGSLVYNRGGSLRDIPSRREMIELGPAIKDGDYARMAQLIRSMKRLWPTARGLIERRETEAAHLDSLVEQ